MTSPIARRALNFGVAGLGGFATGLMAARSPSESGGIISSAQAAGHELDLTTDEGLFHAFIRIAGSTGNLHNIVG